MSAVFVAAVVVVWLGSLATVALALGERAEPAQRSEARLALSVAAALPLCLAATPLADVSRRTLVDGLVELVDEIGDAIRWLAGLSTSDALWVLERAWRAATFILIIALAVALLLGAIWTVLWLCSLSFGGLNLAFDWMRIPWVLPDVQPPSWTLAADRVATAAAKRQRVNEAFSAGRRSMFRPEFLEDPLGVGSQRAATSAHARADDEPAPADGGQDAAGRDGMRERAQTPNRDEPLNGAPPAPDVVVPPLPPLPSLTAEGRFRLSTALLDLRPATGIPRIDRRWLSELHADEPLVFEPTQKDPPR